MPLARAPAPVSCRPCASAARVAEDVLPASVTSVLPTACSFPPPSCAWVALEASSVLSRPQDCTLWPYAESMASVGPRWSLGPPACVWGLWPPCVLGCVRGTPRPLSVTQWL